MIISREQITFTKYIEYIRRYNTYYTADGDSASQVVFQACYGITASAPNQNDIRGGCVIPLSLDNVIGDAFLDYDSLTEEMLLEWCEESQPNQIEAQKTVMIEKMMEQSLGDEVEFVRGNT